MNRMSTDLTVLALLISVIATLQSRALAVQFPVLDPTYTQQIYASTTPSTPNIGVLGAWTTTGNLLTRDGSNVLEYSPAQNLSIHGTSIHTVTTTHAISGLNSNGAGITNGLNGFLYANSTAGLERIDPSNWAAPATLVTSSPGFYGITTLPDGRIAYSDGTNNSSVWLYNPSNNSNNLIYNVNNLIDGMVAGPTGDIAVTNHNSTTPFPNFTYAIQIIDTSGNVINNFTTSHAPDGLAFADSPSASILYANNNDGTISKYTFPSPGYIGTPTLSLIATGSQAYGDLAAVGPDCAFYVSQFDNGGQNGSTNGVGTNWDDNTTTTDPSIIRIGGGVMPDGSTVCQFYSPLEGPVPEPASLSILLGTVLLLLYGGRLRIRSAN